MDYQARRREQAQQTEQAILRAAAELSRESSFDKISIRDICRRAGVTTGAFYHHFPSKEDLLVKGFASLDAYMQAHMDGHGGDAPLDRLHRLLTGYAAFFQEQGCELVGRYYQHRLESPSFASMSPSRFTLRAMLACLEELREAGILAPGTAPAWAAEFLFRHFRGVVVDWVLHQGAYPLLPALEQDYRFFARSFQSGAG